MALSVLVMMRKGLIHDHGSLCACHDRDVQCSELCIRKPVSASHASMDQPFPHHGHGTLHPLHCMILYIDIFNVVFNISALSFDQWLVVMKFSAPVLLVDE